jgi:hypothetical protein
MTARSTFSMTVAQAAAAEAATKLQAEMTRQTAIDAVLTVVGYTTQSGNNANLVSTTKSAGAAQLVTLEAAEATKQSTIAVAKDTLKNSGDLGSA